jgi:glycosyltransferase involved in cell wall biosynthesis
MCLRQHEFWEDRIRGLGVSVNWIGRSKSKMGRLLRILWELRRDPPSVFQSAHFYTNAYAGVTARQLGLAGIGALRGNGAMEVADCGWFGGWLNLHTPGIVAANSEAAMAYAVQLRMPPDHLFLLGNVVDTDQFSPGAERGPGPVRLLSVGRLIPSKRLDRFVGLLARLRSEAKCEVIGAIVGDGPLLGALKAQAAALRLPSSVLEFRGSIAEMAPIYREGDVLVMTSEAEGTPNVLLEAMASALPVVSTAVGGVSEIIRHGRNGFLVGAYDESRVCAVVERLVQEPALRLAIGKQARAYVLANHSLERLPSLLSALYERAQAALRVGAKARWVESVAP